MKKILLLLFVLTISFTGLMGGSVRAKEIYSIKEIFPDQNLRTEICLNLNKTETDTITTSEAEEVRSLVLNAKGIKSIEGLDIFTNLLLLDLSENEIKEIPKDMSKLQSLRILIINDNQISELGSGIMSLTKLEVLAANGNKINDLPSDIGNFDKLEQLQLQGNLITSLPKEISGLKALELFILEGNLIKELPKGIGELNNLTILDMRGNRLESIPWEIGDLSKVYFLDFSSNKIHKMDIHLFNKLDGIKAVYFFNQYYSENIDYQGIVFQDMEFKGLDIYTLDLGFNINQVLVKPDGTEVNIENAIHGDFVIISANDLDYSGDYTLRTTLTGGTKNSFGDEEMIPSVYEQKFEINESKKLPENDRIIYLYGSIGAFCLGLVLLVSTRVFKNKGGF
ncbi:MAG: leucine-rich repeat domain-containing protein [Firmicutes bacterium]|nr:leucine-rich repeat domain-containing protein [Bacillota bacterium]